jgi:hypothetical protein
METKHTPGPWSLSDRTDSITWGDCSFSAPVGAGGFVIASHSVCTIPRHQRERLTDEHRANARLIAAAPELLKALVWLRNSLGPSDYDHAIALADAAIAKATAQ